MRWQLGVLPVSSRKLRLKYTSPKNQEATIASFTENEVLHSKLFAISISHKAQEISLVIPITAAHRELPEYNQRHYARRKEKAPVRFCDIHPRYGQS